MGFLEKKKEKKKKMKKLEMLCLFATEHRAFSHSLFFKCYGMFMNSYVHLEEMAIPKRSWKFSYLFQQSRLSVFVRRKITNRSVDEGLWNMQLCDDVT